MRKRFRSLLALALPVALGLALVPAVVATASAKPAVEAPIPPASNLGWPKPLKTAVNITVAVQNLEAGEASLAIAYYKGWYKRLGLNVTLESTHSFTSVFPALATGQLDFADGGLNANIFNAEEQGIETKIVEGLEVAVPGSDPAGLFVSNSLVNAGKYTGFSSLKGLTIGIGPSNGSSTEFYVLKMLQMGGLTQSDVHLLVVPFQNVAAAMTNGSIQAAFEVEPYATQLIQEGIATREAIGDQIIPGNIDLFLDMSPQFGLKHSLAAKYFVYATMRAEEYYLNAFLLNKHPTSKVNVAIRQGIANILAGYTGVPATTILASGLGGANLDGQFNLGVMLQFEQYFISSGSMTTLLQPLDSLVNFSYARWATQQLRIPISTKGA